MTVERCSTPENAVQTRTCTIWLDEFLRARFLPNAVVELADAEENLEACLALTAGRPRPAIIDLRQIRSQSAAARDYFAGPRANRVSTAVALLVGSPLSRVLGNFYLGFNRPKEPTRLCGSEAEAEAWLRSLDGERR